MPKSKDASLQYRHYGWQVSPYTAKTRAGLRFKRASFEDIAPDYRTMKKRLAPKVGRIIMPVMETPEGEYLQDSTVILDHLEQQFPERPLLPVTPRQRLLCRLIELYADEWLPSIALHYRWYYKEQNYAFITREFGASALPNWPGFVQRFLGRKLADRMQSYLPLCGVTERSVPAVERWCERLLSILEDHLQQHRYLLGASPCVADLALYGPIYAHLYRDPYSSALVKQHPALVDWIHRLGEGAPEAKAGQWLEKDAVPSTLDPLLQMIFGEMFPSLNQLVERVSVWLEEHPDADTLPRALGKIDMHIQGVTETRACITYTYWMLQRVLDDYQSLSCAEQQSVDQWLEPCGVLDALQLRLPEPLRLERCRLRRSL
ncbi:glutathione S-transferase family protein [Aestuariirhabdus sp. Z084]|uniref:glutathione S-transferase family protein n=1 Tax=Aestuariirhabdus haliotis TaxID=2918751 RepID=UPI00201B376A|nr:glutathione S-transferase family protein [Aestuariirhabdus haliotis]MCL6415705.1 glutathione S-transferase family protein [Aestuariirhabdus haliotis]MCL6419769.1 glutathione S-transferase family protein [Aestuariirhabdus haliotis]